MNPELGDLEILGTEEKLKYGISKSWKLGKRELKKSISGILREMEFWKINLRMVFLKKLNFRKFSRKLFKNHLKKKKKTTLCKTIQRW